MSSKNIISETQQYIDRIDKDLEKLVPQEVIEKYEDEIIEKSDPEIAYHFIEKLGGFLKFEILYQLGNIILNKGTLELAVSYAINFKSYQKDIYSLETRLLDSKDAKQIYLFLTNIELPNKTYIEKTLKNTNSAEYNFKYARYLLKESPKININEYEEIVLKSTEIYWIYELARTIKKLNNRDIQKYEKRIIELKNPDYICKIIKLTNGQNLNKYEKEILSIKDPKFIYDILKTIESNDIKCNIEVYEDELLKTNNIEIIYMCAKRIKIVNIEKFTKLIIELNNYELMIKYAKEILNERKETINEIQEKIFESKNSEIMTRFVKEVKGIDVQKCFEHIYNLKNIEIICNLAQEFPEINKKALSKRVEDKKDACWSYHFIEYFNEIDFEKHRQIILNSKDPKWNYEFARTFPNMFMREHEKVVIESNNKKYMELFSQLPGSSIILEIKQKTKKVKTQKPKKISKMTEEEALEALNMYLLVENTENIFKCAQICKIKNERLSEIIREKRSARLSMGFISRCPMIDFEDHRQIILDSKDAECNYLFIKYFSSKENINIEEHKQIVNESGNIYWIEQLRELIGKILAKKR